MKTLEYYEENWLEIDYIEDLVNNGVIGTSYMSRVFIPKYPNSTLDIILYDTETAILRKFLLFNPTNILIKELENVE